MTKYLITWSVIQKGQLGVDPNAERLEVIESNSVDEARVEFLRNAPADACIASIVDYT